MQRASSAAYADSRPHYHILDGLRGVAAVMVVIFHIFESFAPTTAEYYIPHGFLAVDFFFILSGFVIGYSYDERMREGKISWGNFLLRRIIRLQPMVIMGTIIGTICFYFGAYNGLPLIAATPWWKLVLFSIMGCVMLPCLAGWDCRGYGEMYPINGPAWSLFFEYIGYILFAIFIRRLSTTALKVLVALLAAGLIAFAVTNPQGDLCYGFALMGDNPVGGMLRLLFSFCMGLLISRTLKPHNVKGAFWICGLILILLLNVPRIGDVNHLLWQNGLFEALCIIVIFPILVWMGASRPVAGERPNRLCTFLGDISFPIYMIHYPFIYVYLRFVRGGNLSFMDTMPWPIILFVFYLVLAYLCLKLYDEPVRRYLTRRFIGKKN